MTLSTEYEKLEDFVRRTKELKTPAIFVKGAYVPVKLDDTPEGTVAVAVVKLTSATLTEFIVHIERAYPDFKANPDIDHNTYLNQFIENVIIEVQKQLSTLSGTAVVYRGEITAN